MAAITVPRFCPGVRSASHSERIYLHTINYARSIVRCKKRESETLMGFHARAALENATIH